MIFDRFTRALKGQNWLMVVVEIFVVVIGIFLGLQMDDWNEERKNQQQEKVYLAKLADDLDAMRIDLLNEMARGTERAERMRSALYALERCDQSASAQADVKFALERYQVSRGINFLDATYNEMVASGALARITNQELKQSIAYVFSTLGGLNSSVLSFRVSLPVVDAIVWKNVVYSVNENGRLTATFDIDAICQNIELRNAFAEMVDIQSDGVGTGKDVIPLVEDLSSRLAEVVRR